MYVTHIGNHRVTITANTPRSQGSIRAPELDEFPEDVLREGFAPQGVTAVYRPPRGPKAILILTFNAPPPPPPRPCHNEYLVYEVRPVVPKPKRRIPAADGNRPGERLRSLESRRAGHPAMAAGQPQRGGQQPDRSSV